MNESSTGVGSISWNIFRTRLGTGKRAMLIMHSPPFFRWSRTAVNCAEIGSTASDGTVSKPGTGTDRIVSRGFSLLSFRCASVFDTTSVSFRSSSRPAVNRKIPTIVAIARRRTRVGQKGPVVSHHSRESKISVLST